jgi:PAS domain S-box-containing protein
MPTEPSPAAGGSAPPAADPAALLDLLPVSVARIGPDQRFRWANARLCRVLGRRREEVAGRTAAELGLRPEVWGDWTAAVDRVLATGQPAELRYACALDGAERLVYAQFAPEPDLTGRPAVVLAVATVDDEVRRLRDALSLSEARFRAFMEHLPAAAWLRDADERYLFVNAEYRRRMGVADADRLGRHPAEVYPPAVAAAVLANDDRAAAEGPIRAEERVPDGGGAERTWLNVKFTLPGPDGRPQFAGVGLDVTDERRREAERLVLEARVQAAQRAESLGVLAGGVAHDFNNILTAVMGFAGLGRELLAGRAGPLADCFTQIETAAERAADLCRLMLAYAGQGRTEVVAVDLAAVARETVGLLAGSHLRRVDVTTQLADPLPPVRGDPTQLRRVVLNLLVNAAEATAASPVRAVTVTADAADLPAADDLPAGRYVRLAVADTGTGMDPATAARVFEPFFTTKFTGRGLGLAAVAGIVRGHGGAVWVTTALGAGSTFEVLLRAAGTGPS